jgi:hypothetical protein
MEKSRKWFLAALGVLLIAQFFQYGTTPENRSVFDMVWKARYYKQVDVPQTGFERNSIFAIAIPILLYLFYKSQRSLFIYLVSFGIMLILGWAGDSGGQIGFISLLIALYALYLRWREPAKTEVRNNPDSIISGKP